MATKCTQCNTVPDKGFDYWNFKRKLRHHICAECWRTDARKSLEQKKSAGLSLDDLIVSRTQPKDSWLASRFTFNECLVYIENRGVNLSCLNMDPESYGAKEEVYGSIRRLAAGDLPCTPHYKTHWVPADGFYYHKSGKTSDGLDYHFSGKPYRVCKAHHDAEKAKSKKLKSKSEDTPAKTIGTGEFAGKMHCCSTLFFYGHWVPIEEYGDQSLKSCEPCRRELQERKKKRLTGERGKPGRKPNMTEEQKDHTKDGEE